jgi:hypothetical protein
MEETPPDAEPESAASTDNRRATPRRFRPVRVFVADSETLADPFPGWVLDRSQGGLRLTVPHEYAPGTLLHVHPPQAPATAPWLQVEVKSCAFQEGAWQLGCQFVRSPSYYVLMQFG